MNSQGRRHRIPVHPQCMICSMISGLTPNWATLKGSYEWKSQFQWVSPHFLILQKGKNNPFPSSA